MNRQPPETLRLTQNEVAMADLARDDKRLAFCAQCLLDLKLHTHSLSDNVGREWVAKAHSALKNGDHDGRRCGSIRRTRYALPMTWL
jgi:hypothetical protein